MLKRVIASALHRLPRTSVESHRFPPVEELVTALHQQKVTLRLRHACDIECLELGKMFARELVRFAADRVALRPQIRRQALGRAYRRIDQHRLRAVMLSQKGRITTAERA